MGIKVEFNPDLALRAFGTAGRLETECLPRRLIRGQTHHFLKEGQRNYWLEGEIPLLETKGNQNLSRPLASITILESTHFIKDNLPYTRGMYKINKVYNQKSKRVHFESYKRID